MSSPNWWGDWRPTLTPHTGNLLATDLIECTMIVGGLPVNTVITGAQILGAVPTPSVAWGSITGTLSSQTDLNTALSGKASTGAVTGTGITMSTARILGRSTAGTGAIEEITIGSGLTLSAGTLTASGGSSSLTVGTTPIASGTVGRILFQGTGNVLQQSGNFSWDNTNRTLRVVTADPSTNARVIDITNTGGFGYFIRTNSVSSQGNSAEFICNNFSLGTIIGFSLQPNGNAYFGVAIGHAPTNYKTIEVVSKSNTAGGFLRMRNANSSAVLDLFTDTTEGVAIASNVQLTFRTGASGIKGTWFGTGNLLIGIGTQTDAGYKLDVNGTTRIQSKLSVGTPSAASAVMEVTSTTQGFLPPRMTNAQMLAIATPAAGLVVYDTTNNKHCGYNGTAWQNFY